MYDLASSPGIYLLKQKIQGKEFEHYAIGLNGVSIPRLGILFTATVIDLSPQGYRAQDWVASGPWTIIARAANTEAAAQRLLSALRDPRYRAVDNNCEQFAREVVTARRESRQVQAVVVGLTVAGLVVWAASNS